MNTKIHWGRVGLSVLVAGVVLGCVFFVGEKSIEQQVAFLSSTGMGQRAVPMNTSGNNVADAHTYKNTTYGFGAIFLSKAEAATECPLASQMAYDPIKEYVFSTEPMECAPGTEDSESFYNVRGSHLETIVFDLTKCRDAVENQREKDFCATYDKAGLESGKTTEKEWPTGIWTKSGDYLTFYLDLSAGKNEHWKADYKFLVMER